MFLCHGLSCASIRSCAHLSLICRYGPELIDVEYKWESSRRSSSHGDCDGGKNREIAAEEKTSEGKEVTSRVVLC